MNKKRLGRGTRFQEAECAGCGVTTEEFGSHHNGAVDLNIINLSPPAPVDTHVFFFARLKTAYLLLKGIVVLYIVLRLVSCLIAPPLYECEVYVRDRVINGTANILAQLYLLERDARFSAKHYFNQTYEPSGRYA